MYCTIDDVKRLLPPTFTIGSQNIGTPTLGSQNVKKDTMTPEEVSQMIGYATQEIDGRLRAFYSCPLRRVKVFETYVQNSLMAGSSVVINLNDSGQFIKGQLVRVQDYNNYENAIITGISDMRNIVLDVLKNNYENPTISILQFPDPIPSVTARLAVSYSFDRFFNAEQAPDISQYGIAQRKLAVNDLDNMIAGVILLFGQEHTGRRFIRMSLLDDFKSPAKDIQFGRESS